jgi:type III secretory pathway component EscS
MELVAEHQVWLASSMHRAAAAVLVGLIRRLVQITTQWQELVVVLVGVVAVLALAAPLVVDLEYLV